MGCMPSRIQSEQDGPGDMKYTAIGHVRQSYSWDCGLACVLMVLRHKGISYTLEDLITMAGTKSVWTVDLAYILARCGLDFVFHTISTGVRPEYGAEAFYKDDLDEDMVRVNRLFQAAPQLNIRLEKRAVEIDEIIGHVCKEGCVAIVLIDKRLMPSGSTIARMIQQHVNLGFIGPPSRSATPRRPAVPAAALAPSNDTDRESLAWQGTTSSSVATTPARRCSASMTRPLMKTARWSGSLTSRPRGSHSGRTRT